MTSCIILAGGLSTRFPGGKLTYRLMTGKRMIEHVVEALHQSGSCSEVLVVASIHTVDALRRALDRVDKVNLVKDEDSLPCRGPLRGITSGALHARHRDVIAVPGDAGWIRPEIISALKEYSMKFNAQIATPLWDDGFMPMLFMYISDLESMNPLDQCLSRRLISRPSDLFRASDRLLLVGSKLLGDSGLELKTINTPRDLMDPRPRIPSLKVVLLRGHSRYFTRATESELLGLPVMAMLNYMLEYSVYRDNDIAHLAMHSLQDACRVARETGNLESMGKLSEKLAGMTRKRHGKMACNEPASMYY